MTTSLDRPNGCGLRITRVGAVKVLTLTDQARLNPLTAALQRGLLQELECIRDDTGIRALVVSGEGRGFCVGADLSTIAATPEDGATVGERTGRLMEDVSNPLIMTLSELPVPVVMAVNGACAGAGVGLALAGDVTLMARSAYFYLPFAPRLGLVPDLGASWFLHRRIGRARALGMMLLDERVTAEQAVEWGLAWAVVDDAGLPDQALAIAERLAKLPSHAVVESRAVLDGAAFRPLPAQLAYEVSRQRELIDRPSFDEGVRAFLEKRQPSFQDARRKSS
jgi:2-(1,2-epoxy-1,2-dihydrophenyl)acetyl-CoA isomerase